MPTNIDPDSDEARLERHRRACSMWPNGRPESNVERQLTQALDHLDAILNKARTCHQSLDAERAGREFLKACGR